MCLVWCSVVIAVCVASSTPLARADVLRLDYDGFTVWLDCARRGAVKFRYNAQRDQGKFTRRAAFSRDPNVPKHCQQTSAALYRHSTEAYDRGHLVPANHLDNSATALKQSNYMTNVVPMTKTVNRGAWLLTEQIIECYRDIDELLVIGGVIWGNNPADDYFLSSHGVTTPDAFWKLIIRGTGRVMAWIIPNTKEATRKRLDHYLVSIEELERRTGETNLAINPGAYLLEGYAKSPFTTSCFLGRRFSYRSYLIPWPLLPKAEVFNSYLSNGCFSASASATRASAFLFICSSCSFLRRR
jgi:endonuclease G